MLLTKLLTLITHILKCVPSLGLGLLFVFSLLHPELVHDLYHFPEFKRTLSVSSKVHAGMNT